MSNVRIDRQKALRAFADYAAQYDSRDGRIALKVRHTYKVADLCERIAAASHYDEAFCDLSWLSGLLHDIGRFEQIRQYGTFSDAKSFSHALMSSKVLFEQGRLHDFIPDFALSEQLSKALDTAISVHSLYQVPDDIDGTALSLSNVLRDADKLDILRVCNVSDVQDTYGVTKQQLLESELTPCVVDAYYDRHTIHSSLKETPADFVLGQCAFGWDLTHEESRAIAWEQGYLEALFDTPFERSDVRDAFKKAKEHMLAVQPIHPPALDCI